MSDSEQFFMCLLAISVSSLGEVADKLSLYQIELNLGLYLSDVISIQKDIEVEIRLA